MAEIYRPRDRSIMLKNHTDYSFSSGFRQESARAIDPFYAHFPLASVWLLTINIGVKSVS